MNVALLGRAAEFFASRSARNIAHARRQRLENRIEPLNRFLGTTNHHAITALDAPYAAAGPYIDVMHAFALQLPGAANVVFEIRVSAVDDGVAGLQMLRQLLNRLFGSIARGNHDPDGARRF